MKKKRHARDERLIELLQSAYFAKNHRLVDDRWQRSVMQRIRSMEPISRQSSDGLSLERLLWRMAPAVALLVVMVACGLALTGRAPEYDLYQAFGDELALSGFLVILSI